MNIKKRKVYPNLKALGLTTDVLAEMMGYKTGAAFRSSTAHTRLMVAMNDVAGLAFMKTSNESPIEKELSKEDVMSYLEQHLT